MEQLSIAKVIKPQGLKGELKCSPMSENVQLYNNLKTVFCDGVTLNVISSVFRLGFVYITLENVASIEQAEKFRGKTFYVNKDTFGSLPENTFFIDDLIGMSVFDENNELIGEVLGYENYGATDILQIKDKWATYLVPFVQKVFKAVDVESKKIIVNRFNYEENKV